MYDMFDKLINIGDEVLYSQSGSYAGLSHGVVEGFSAKGMVKIRVISRPGGRYINRSNGSHYSYGMHLCVYKRKK